MIEETHKGTFLCGGHILTDHKPMELLDVYAAVISDLSFEPSSHVFYAESVLHIKDELPKYKDLPQEAGGASEQLPE